MRLIFGAFDLTDLLQAGTYSASPREIIIHEDWNPNVEQWDADIAMFITDDDIPVTKFIKPICLWDDLSQPSMDEGIIAGWGKAENSSTRHENIPKQLKIPILELLDCVLKSPDFAKLASRRMFCGGSRNGSGPCNGL